MKILVYTDVHWSAYSSIIRKRGEKYSQRLEKLIQSVSWAENLSKEHHCDKVVCLGDFFDKSELTAEEITALKEVVWNNEIPHYFLVGNHEMGTSDLSYSSAHLFNLENFHVIDNVSMFTWDKTNIVFIPYILENNRKSFEEYVKKSDMKTVVFSHNDLQIQYGAYKSEIGFTINEIECNCDKFINGHLHNGEEISNKVINLGNLTGQNFGEDAYRYAHNAMILDTNTLQHIMIENPYAFNFYKIDYNLDFPNKLKHLSPNAIVAIRVKENDYSKVKEIVSQNNGIVEARFVVEKEISDVEKVDVSELSSIDHLRQFTEYIVSNFGNSEIIDSELLEVCR